jgi:hypothetical protein
MDHKLNRPIPEPLAQKENVRVVDSNFRRSARDYSAPRTPVRGLVRTE